MMSPLLCNPKSVILSLFGALLGSSRWLAQPPIDLPKGQPLNPNHDPQSTQIGLKTLIPPQEEPLFPTTIITKPYTLFPSPHLSRSTSATSTTSLSRSSSYLSRSSSLSLDDLIGSDSGVHMSYNEDTSLPRSNSVCSTCNTRKKSRVRKCCDKERDDYPPPIPSLATTGSLPGRMSWVMTRQYDDGKLILRQERAQQQEYIECRREDGRLIMKLVPFEKIRYEEEEEEEEDTIEALKLVGRGGRGGEDEVNESFKLKSPSPVSFSVCSMTTVP